MLSYKGKKQSCSPARLQQLQKARATRYQYLTPPIMNDAPLKESQRARHGSASSSELSTPLPDVSIQINSEDTANHQTFPLSPSEERKDSDTAALEDSELDTQAIRRQSARARHLKRPVVRNHSDLNEPRLVRPGSRTLHRKTKQRFQEDDAAFIRRRRETLQMRKKRADAQKGVEKVEEVLKYFRTPEEATAARKAKATSQHPKVTTRNQILLHQVSYQGKRDYIHVSEPTECDKQSEQQLANMMVRGFASAVLRHREQDLHLRWQRADEPDNEAEHHQRLSRSSSWSSLLSLPSSPSPPTDFEPYNELAAEREAVRKRSKYRPSALGTSKVYPFPESGVRETLPANKRTTSLGRRYSNVVLDGDLLLGMRAGVDGVMQSETAWMRSEMVTVAGVGGTTSGTSAEALEMQRGKAVEADTSCE